MATKERNRKVQTTVRLPRTLYEQAKGVVEDRNSEIDSFNDFLVAAITAYLKMLKRRRIDAAFCGVAEDTDYQKEALLISEQFAGSDWEALEIAEKDNSRG